MENETTDEKQLPAPVKIVHVAHLDAERIYWGVIAKPADQLQATDVEVPHDCDLKEGHYQWDWNNRRFEPLMHLFVDANDDDKKRAGHELLRQKNRDKSRRPPVRPS